MKNLILRNKKYKKRDLKAGFGILEVMIASAIIAIFAAGIVVLGKMTLRLAIIQKHRLQAAYLAQSATEAVRNIRDSNWVDDDDLTDWDSGIENYSESGSVKVNQKSPEENYKWYLEEGIEIIDWSDLRTHLKETVFRREIYITVKDSENIDIKIVVNWDDYGKPRNVTVESRITDWKIQ